MRVRASFTLFIVCGVTGLVVAGYAQAPSDDGAAVRVRAHVEFLADDLLEGRETGTRGHELAARYVATTLRSYGFEPAAGDGSFFQPVPLREATLTDGSIVVTAKDGVPVPLRMPEDAIVVPDSRRAEVRVTAPVVYAGYGVSAPDLQYDDYAGIDVRGKVVVLSSQAPLRFPGDVRAHYSSVGEKVQTAARHGAVAAMLLSDPAMEKVIPWTALAGFFRAPFLDWTDAGGEPGNADPRLQAGGMLGPAGAEKLFAGAPEPLAGVYAAAAAGTPRPFDLPVSMTITTATAHRLLTSPNVLGVLRGRDPELADSYVLLTAHLDHVGVGQEVNGDRIYNGAFDNALGCAILLEVARTLASLAERPRRSVLVAFVTAEEKMLVGSDFLARNPPVPREQLVAAVNLDMPLLQWPLADVVAFGAEHSTLDAIVEGAARQMGLGLAPDPVPDQNLFIRSDQYSFVKQGVPSVYLMPAFTSREPGKDHGSLFGAFLSTHYHQPSDDPSLPMDAGAIAAFARVNTAIVLAIANDPVRPAWKPESFFGRTFGSRAGTR